MKTKLLVSFTFIACLTAAQSALVASWDAWADGSGPGAGAADSVVSGFTATAVTGSDRAISVYTSNDGTFGTVAGADTTNTFGVGLRQNSTPLLTVTLTNGTTSDYRIDSLHFDYERRASSPDAFDITYVSGGLGPASTIIASQSGIALGSYSAGAADFTDYDYNLAPALSDTVLGVGESAVFTFLFKNGINTNSGIFDNLAFQGVAVPEPSAALLGGLGSLLLLRRRR